MDLYEQVATRKVPFLLVFFGVILVTYGVLFAVDFIPEPVEEEGVVGAVEAPGVVERVQGLVQAFNGGLVPKKSTTTEETEKVSETVGLEVIIPETEVKEESSLKPEVFGNSSAVDPTPDTITIKALDRTVKVLNPTSNSIAVLDEALLSGVVRHPDSADFSEPGNILILGHSSYLPNVFNKNFQALNGIQELSWGDSITVASSDTEYVYQVDRVYKAKAAAVEVPVTKGVAKLTLVTCNSFGAKEDRFIVEATLVNSYKL